jgi:hypothetical protein
MAGTRSWQINILPKWLRLRAAVAAPLALASKDLREPAALRVDQLHQNSGPSGQRRHHQDAQLSSRLGRRVGGAAINVIGRGERVKTSRHYPQRTTINRNLDSSMPCSAARVPVLRLSVRVSCVVQLDYGPLSQVHARLQH